MQQHPGLAPFETAFTVVCNDETSDLVSFDGILEDARASNGQQTFRLKALMDVQVILLTNKSQQTFSVEQHLNVLEDGVIVETHQDKKVITLVFPGIYEKGKPSAQLSGLKFLKGETNVILRSTAAVDMSTGLVTGGVILG
jgi:hypothetical protein